MVEVSKVGLGRDEGRGTIEDAKMQRRTAARFRDGVSEEKAARGDGRAKKAIDCCWGSPGME